MATIQELGEALVNADAAGDTQAAQMLASEIQRMQGEAVQSQPQAESAGVLRDYVAPAVRGLAPTAIGAGVGMVAGIPAGPAGMAAGARMGAAASETATLAGDLGAAAINALLGTRFTNPSEAWDTLLTKAGLPKSETQTQKVVEASARGLGSTLGTMGLGSFLKGSASKGIATVGEILSQAPKEQMAAGLIGAGAGELARSEVEKMGGSAGEQAAASLLTGIVTGVAAGRLAGFKAGAGAAANPILQAAEREGVDLTTSLLNPPTSLPGKYMQTLGANIPLAGTGKQMMKSAEQGSEMITNFLADYGVTHGAGAPLTQEVLDNLIKTRGKNIVDLVDQKRGVIDPLARSGVAVPMTNTMAEIDAQIAKLNGINPEAYAPITQKLEAFKEAIQNKTLDAIEGNRKVLRGMKADPSLGVIKDDAMKAIDSAYTALKSDMGSFIETQSGAAARDAWNKADTKLFKLTDDLELHSFKSVLKDNAASPEKIASMLANKRDSDLNVLISNTDAQGKEALKGALLQMIANKSDTGGVISQQKFMTNLNKFSSTVSKLFTPDEIQRIKAIGTILEKLTFARNFAPDAPTGIKGVVPQSAVLMGATAAGVLGKGLLIGAGWNIYESKMMRNLLEKIARNPPEQAQLIKRAATMFEVGYARSVGHEMLKNNIPITFDPNTMKQEQVGTGNVTTDMAHGYRAVSKDGKKQRLYGPDNQLIGVFDNIDQVRRYTDRQVVNKIKLPK